jgi:hypothetical protein
VALCRPANGAQSLLIVLKTVAALGNEAFVDVIIAVCKDLHVEDDDVWYAFRCPECAVR